jgi:hypothetical protein
MGGRWRLVVNYMLQENCEDKREYELIWEIKYVVSFNFSAFSDVTELHDDEPQSGWPPLA